MASGPIPWNKLLDCLTKGMAAVPPYATGGLVTPSNRIQVNSGITSTGMNGFSESGSPDEWDMAIGEVYGYRWWKMAVPVELAGWMRASSVYREFEIQEHPLLGANSYYWTPGRQEAVCKVETAYPSWPSLIQGVPPLKHEPPEVLEACGCGFWAYFDPMLEVDNVLGGFNGQVPARSGNAAYLPVFGVVKGTGRVIIGEKGFRSQFAEIVGLCVADSTKNFLKWKFSQANPAFRDDYDQSYYLRAALKGSLGYFGNSYASMWSGGGSGRLYSYDSRQPEEYIVQASDSERLSRYASVEHILSEAYPGARVFCDQYDMVRYFPPDPNYGSRYR